VPVMRWVKGVMDYIIAKYFGAKEVEFEWGEPDKADPLVEAQIAQIYLTGKVLTPDEVRDDLGLDPLTADQQALLTPPPPPALMGGQPPGDGSGPKGNAPPAKPASGEPPASAADATKLGKKKRYSPLLTAADPRSHPYRPASAG
jgi:hypothetical protein